MFVYKVLWIFTVKCLQLFNKELYVYFCTDSILSCFSWIQPITVTKAAALVHFAMTWLNTMTLHWCYCRSKGRTLACFVSSFKDRNQGGPAHPQHTWHSLRHNCSRSSVCPGARLGLYLERPQTGCVHGRDVRACVSTGGGLDKFGFSRRAPASSSNTWPSILKQSCSFHSEENEDYSSHHNWLGSALESADQL